MKNNYVFQKISEKSDIGFVFLANIVNVWLYSGQLDSPSCFCIHTVETVV